MKVRLLIKKDRALKVHIGLMQFITPEGAAFGNYGWSGKEVNWAARIRTDTANLTKLYKLDDYCKTCLSYATIPRKIAAQRRSLLLHRKETI